jgi:hypothetical protein
MKGFPKWFNTRRDVDLCLREYPDLMKAQIREWLDNRYCWQASGQIVPPDTGIEDDTHRIERREDGTVWQLVYAEDSNSLLARLGISIQEAEGMIV